MTSTPEAGTKPRRPRQWRRDQLLLDAADEALTAVVETARRDTVGDHLGAVMIGDRLAVHRFATTDPGYPGWLWEVSVARAPRSKKVTICEVDMAPGEAALLAPPWIPWSDRLEPSDISPTDVLPYEANDPRLQSGFEQTDDLGADALPANSIGYGRPRVLSPEGLDQAATRWYNSARGPVPGTRAKAMCNNCGFLVKISGPLGSLFGVCANGWSRDDGSVVSLDHTCGAHSETDQTRRAPQFPIMPSRVDDTLVEYVPLPGAEEEDQSASDSSADEADENAPDDAVVVIEMATPGLNPVEEVREIPLKEDQDTQVERVTVRSEMEPIIEVDAQEDPAVVDVELSQDLVVSEEPEH